MVATNRKIIALIFIFLGLLVFLVFYTSQKKMNSKKVMRVYAYSSFSGKNGPGPKLRQVFKNKSGVDIQFVSSDSALIMLTKFMKDKKPVDLFVGVDQLTKKIALEKINWNKSDIKMNEGFYEAIKSDSPYLVAYNWAPMTFIFREGEVKAPNSWAEVLAGEYKLSLPDPRTSSPGNIFLFWFYDQFKESFVSSQRRLNKNIKNLASSWSSSYGLFTNGNTNMTFSYLTSLAYHITNNELNYQAAQFESGHPYQVEYLGIPKNCLHCESAKAFAQFILTPEAQKILMKKNFMLPVRKSVIEGSVYEHLPKLKLIPFKQMQEFIDNKKSIIESWKSSMRG